MPSADEMFDQIISRLEASLFSPTSTVMRGSSLANLLASEQSPGMSSSRGMLESGNINVGNRPQVRNPDGSISTVRSMSANFGDGEVLMPTVSDDGRIMGDEEAVQNYLVKRRHLGRFDTPENADRFAERLHEDQERMYAPFQFK